MERTVTQVSGVLLSAVLFACMCNAQPAEIQEIRFGALLPITGSAAPNGESAKAAVEMAAEDFNNFLHSEGVLGELVLRALDTQADPDAALAQMEEIKNSGTSHTVVGPYSSEPVGIPGKSLLKSVFPSENRPLGRFLYRGARIFSSPIRIL